tara:strand:+ start:169 stop:444 length:276 start_codon:yes stop_codon:yes gene_type:complete
MNKIFQSLFRWMPVILFILLIMLDRNNKIYVFGYIILLFSYSGILILRLLHDKKEWHSIFNKEKNMSENFSIEKLSDLKENLDKKFKNKIK